MQDKAPDLRMAKVEGSVTRKETTSVNGVNYDVIKLEKYLEEHPEAATSAEMSLSDPRIHDSVSEGNTYWATTSGESLGPSHFINLWTQKSAEDSSLTVDKFLEDLKVSHADWIDHINSIQYAINNLDRAIWLYADEQTHPFPFDGIHRLTRAYLENLPIIKTVIWNSLPEEAQLP